MEWQDQQAKNYLDRPIYWFNSNEMIFQLFQKPWGFIQRGKCTNRGWGDVPE